MSKTKKVLLTVTLAQLQDFTAPVLRAIFNEATGQTAKEDLDAESLLSALLTLADPAPEPEPVQSVSSDALPVFEYKKKKYQVLTPKVHIPGIGDRTAKELATDDESIEYLIKNQCVGSVIKEVK
ncbi:MAG: hypothetical protein ACTHMC_05230 [Pseudobacter sp.]|uniref:hypothetical protein n=1 Tax=Pseudobacter sp. TaxID=2045420 RepID=UPI003F7E7C39